MIRRILQSANLQSPFAGIWRKLLNQINLWERRQFWDRHRIPRQAGTLSLSFRRLLTSFVRHKPKEFGVFPHNSNGMLVWDKEVYGMGNTFRFQHELVVFCSEGVPNEGNTHNTGNVLKVKRLVNTEHPTQNPVPLVEIFLKMSTLEGDLVLDPFIGSGTTAVACQQMGRMFIGFELDRKYVALAKKRLTQRPLSERCKSEEKQYGNAGRIPTERTSME